MSNKVKWIKSSFGCIHNLYALSAHTFVDSFVSSSVDCMKRSFRIFASTCDDAINFQEWQHTNDGYPDRLDSYVDVYSLLIIKLGHGGLFLHSPKKSVSFIQ